MDSDSDDESYIISAERKAKQNYLSEEILDNHYDPELFMLFCGRRKVPDIDAWSFDDLTECVQDFKMTYRRGQSLQEVLDAEELKNKKTKPKIYSSQSKQELPPPEMPKPEKVEPPVTKFEKVLDSSVIPLKPVEKVVMPVVKLRKNHDPVKILLTSDIIGTHVSQNDTNSTNFTIRCRKAETTPLSTCKIVEFIIKDPEYIDARLLSKFYLYPVYTSPLGWECKRKYSDYVWLKETLNTLLPSIYIPPLLPIKTIQGSENDTVNKRRAMIKKFTLRLSRNPLILSLPVVENFFKISNKEEFSEFMKFSKKKINKVETAEMAYSLDGLLNCTLADQGKSAENIMKFAIGAENIEKRLKKQIKVVLGCAKNIEEDLKSVGKLMMDLEEAHRGIMIKNSGGKVFGELASGFDMLYKLENERESAVNEHFNMQFKYSCLEKNQMKLLLKDREQRYAEYIKAESKMQNFEKYRNMFGLYNNTAIREVMNAINEENSHSIQNFLKFTKKSTELASKTHTIWSKLRDEFTRL